MNGKISHRMKTLDRGSASRLAIVTATAVIASVIAHTLASAAGERTRPESCIAPNRSMTLYADELPSRRSVTRIGWGTTPENASIPGPTIEMVEDDCLAITVVNDVSRRTLVSLADQFGGHHVEGGLGVSLHVHGVKYTIDSDGTAHNRSIVPPGASRTYTWYAEPRGATSDGFVSPGSARYWWYHDHVVGTDHGTGGLASGLFGALIVRRAHDPRPDRTYPIFMGPGPKINMAGYPRTDCPRAATPSPHCLIAEKGERVEFVVVGVGDDFHTFHLHGHTWVDNRTGLLTSPADETRLIDAKTIGPSESFGFQVVAGHEVGVGDWMLHCHVQAHSDHGMATFFRVRPLAPGETNGEG